MMNVLLRAFLAARIPLAYSEGFHAHPLVSFGPPLSLSFTADNELFDMVTTETWTEECDGINKFLPEGLRLKRRGEIGLRHVSLNEDICAGRYCFGLCCGGRRPLHGSRIAGLCCVAVPGAVGGIRYRTKGQRREDEKHQAVGLPCRACRGKRRCGVRSGTFHGAEEHVQAGGTSLRAFSGDSRVSVDGAALRLPAPGQAGRQPIGPVGLSHAPPVISSGTRTI